MTLWIFCCCLGCHLRLKKSKSLFDFSTFLGNPISIWQAWGIRISLIYCPNGNLKNLYLMNQICFPNGKPHSNHRGSKPPKLPLAHGGSRSHLITFLWPNPTTAPNSSSIASRVPTWKCHRFPIGFNGPLHIHCHNCPLLWGNSTKWHIFGLTQPTTPYGHKIHSAILYSLPDRPTDTEKVKISVDVQCSGAMVGVHGGTGSRILTGNSPVPVDGIEPVGCLRRLLPYRTIALFILLRNTEFCCHKFVNLVG